MVGMKLKEYLQTDGVCVADVARKVGVAPAYLYQMATGRRGVSAKRATAIEEATDGNVRRQDLLPSDWHRIWPELAANDQAREVVNG